MDVFAGLLTDFAELGRLLLPVVYVIAVAVGFAFAGMALFKLKHIGEEGRRGATWGGFFGNTVVCFGSVALASICNTLSKDYGSIGSGVASQMAYIRDGSAANLKPMWDAIYAWLLLLGVCAVWRGFLLINKAASGQSNDGDHVWQAVWHLLGGAIVINIATRL